MVNNNGMAERVEAVRHFNRFYTQQIGVLNEGLLESPFSLTEARIIYELAHQEATTASELCGRLALDAGYLSRILAGFKKRGLITKKASGTDARQQHLVLTKKGREAFATLNERSRRQIEALLKRLPGAEQERLIASMHSIESLLGEQGERREPYLLRPHRPGDMGWIVHRHGLLYAQEYGWNEQFEALVAKIAGEFLEKFDARLERCWIAEMDGEIVGSVLLVKKSKAVAKLRLLLVEPRARGLGIGSRLTEECIRFARQVGYSKITLWTNSVLLSARHIYKKAGFRMVQEEPHHSFGHDLVSETWELVL